MASLRTCLLTESDERKSRDDRAASSYSAHKQLLYVSLSIASRLRNLRLQASRPLASSCSLLLTTSHSIPQTTYRPWTSSPQVPSRSPWTSSSLRWESKWLASSQMIEEQLANPRRVFIKLRGDRTVSGVLHVRLVTSHRRPSTA